VARLGVQRVAELAYHTTNTLLLPLQHLTTAVSLQLNSTSVTRIRYFTFITKDRSENYGKQDRVKPEATMW